MNNLFDFLSSIKYLRSGIMPGVYAVVHAVVLNLVIHKFISLLIFVIFKDEMNFYQKIEKYNIGSFYFGCINLDQHVLYFICFIIDA